MLKVQGQAAAASIDFLVHKWEMTSDELCARDLIKLDAAPDRKDYSDVRGSKKTCSTKV